MCNFVKEAAAINIEDIYFFEVNTEYILSRVSKTSEFSRVRSTSENSDVFHSRDEIYLVFTEKRKFYFYFILFIKKEVLKMQKQTILLTLIIFVTF